MKNNFKNPFKNKKLYILSIIFLFFFPVTLFLFFLSMLLGFDNLFDFTVNVLTFAFLHEYGRYSDLDLYFIRKSKFLPWYRINRVD